MAFIQISLVQLAQCTIQYVVSFWVSNTNRSLEKQSTYECGLEPMGNSRMKFDIIYYIIGILYLIFDLEIIFQFPLATVLFSLNSQFAFWVALIFQIILTIGFIYDWFMGALKIY